jgi:hypothetical protein
MSAAEKVLQCHFWIQFAITPTAADLRSRTDFECSRCKTLFVAHLSDPEYDDLGAAMLRGGVPTVCKAVAGSQNSESYCIGRINLDDAKLSSR